MIWIKVIGKGGVNWDMIQIAISALKNHLVDFMKEVDVSQSGGLNTC